MILNLTIAIAVGGLPFWITNLIASPIILGRIYGLWGVILPIMFSLLMFFFAWLNGGKCKERYSLAESKLYDEAKDATGKEKPIGFWFWKCPECDSRLEKALNYERGSSEGGFVLEYYQCKKCNYGYAEEGTW